MFTDCVILIDSNSSSSDDDDEILLIDKFRSVWSWGSSEKMSKLKGTV